jgi:DNA-binding NtrC family response regulator/CheY-like chemotaxis protein
MKVLIVEDLSDWQIIINDALDFNKYPPLVEALKERGIILPGLKQIEIKSARSQYEARQLIQEEDDPYDLVILDLLIPEKPNQKADPLKGSLLGYPIVSDIRSKFGEDVPIVVYSNYLGSKKDKEPRGMVEFLDMLRGRNMAPPNEMLWKEQYYSYSLLMRKLVRYAIDLTPADEARLKEAGILFSEKGAIRRVLRELKRMACSASIGLPRSDVLLLGENGVGKTTFARAYHLLRPKRPDQPQLAFEHLDLGSLDFAGSAPNIALFGATDFNGAWSLGAFVRSTMYKRGTDFLHFAGQELEPGYKRDLVKSFASLGKSSYPESGDQIDFDGCGTLFLDEVVNISLEVQAMLLQALSYDLHTRHVYTTGHAPRRLRVAPSLVFATAQRLDLDQAANSGDHHFRRMKDYLFRIDQMRVTIPPLRAREPSEVILLLKALVMKRRPKDSSADEIEIDPIIENLLTTTLLFRNNVADLQRIADQVMPEESTISWQHVGPLFERERPLVSESHVHLRDEASNSSENYARAMQIYERYLADFVNKGQKLSLSRLTRELDIGRKEAYNTALVFMDACGCPALKRWPTDEQTLQIFDHSSKAFQTYIHRISPYRNSSFSLDLALRDLANLKIKNVLD